MDGPKDIVKSVTDVKLNVVNNKYVYLYMIQVVYYDFVFL